MVASVLTSYLFGIKDRASLPFDGAIAQLGERLICIQEVSGSIPLSSTIFVLWSAA